MGSRKWLLFFATGEVFPTNGAKRVKGREEIVLHALNNSRLLPDANLKQEG